MTATIILSIFTALSMRAVAAEPAKKKTNECDKSSTSQAEKFKKLIIVGQIEHVVLSPTKDLHLGMTARIDTGAETSSVHALNITEMNRVDAAGKKEKWVKFKLKLDSSEHIIETPIVRRADIKQSSTKGSQRIVVKLDFAMGKLQAPTEFSLVDRGHLEYKLLLGRNFLKDRAIVDVSRSCIAGAGI